MKLKLSQVLEGKMMRSDKTFIGQVQSFPSLLSLIATAFLITRSVQVIDILV